MGSQSVSIPDTITMTSSSSSSTSILHLASLLLSSTAGDSSVSNLLNSTTGDWTCPDYGVHFLNNVIGYWDGVFSWQECCILCNDTPHCMVWSWSHPRSEGVVPKRCYLHYSDTAAIHDDRGIAGRRNCYTSCPP